MQIENCRDYGSRYDWPRDIAAHGDMYGSCLIRFSITCIWLGVFQGALCLREDTLYCLRLILYMNGPLLSLAITIRYFRPVRRGSSINIG